MSLFGTQPKPSLNFAGSTNSGLFGAPSQQPQQQGGLFGQQQQGLGTKPAFGQSTTTGGTGFGQSTGFTQPVSVGGGPGLFGQAQQQGGMFRGQSQHTGGFGQSAMNTPQQGMWGGASQAQQTMPSPQTNPIVEKLQRVKSAWDPSHADYAFTTYLYNNLGEDIASKYQKPLYDDSQKWEEAWAKRPSKSCVPVLAKGFSDLESRVKVQERDIVIFRSNLWQIQEQLSAIQSKHDLQTSIKLEDCRRKHIALTRRALSLAAKVQVLKNRGYALQPEEEQLKKRLDGLVKMVQDPATTGRMNEIWARMMVVQEKARVLEESMGKVEIVWDEKQLQTTGRLLQRNTAGLMHLKSEVQDIENACSEVEESIKSRRGL